MFSERSSESGSLSHASDMLQLVTEREAQAAADAAQKANAAAATSAAAQAATIDQQPVQAGTDDAARAAPVGMPGEAIAFVRLPVGAARQAATNAAESTSSVFGHGAVVAPVRAGALPVPPSLVEVLQAPQPRWQGHCGWLHKQGLVNTAWKRRFFRISNGSLLWFEEETDAESSRKPKGSLSLAGAEIQEGRPFSSEFGRFPLKLTPAKGAMRVLEAASKKERTQWIEALSEAVLSEHRRLVQGALERQQ